MRGMRNSNEILFENWWEYTRGRLRYPVMGASVEGVNFVVIIIIIIIIIIISPISPLCRVSTHIFLRQTMSLGNTELQLF